MIYASFQSQYGIRLSRDLPGMSWREFSYLINGLSGDSPLGRIASIRAENDPDILKEFSPEMKKIRNEYRSKVALRMDKGKADSGIEEIRQALVAMGRKREET